MKSFDYNNYRHSRKQVNFLLRSETATRLKTPMAELRKSGAIPEATLPCLAKFGLKVVAYLYENNRGLLLQFSVRKGEL